LPRITSQILEACLRHHPEKKSPTNVTASPHLPAKLLKSAIPQKLTTHPHPYNRVNNSRPDSILPHLTNKNEHTQPHPTPPRTLPPPSPFKLPTPPHRRPRLYTPLASNPPLTQRLCFLYRNITHRRSHTRGGKYSSPSIMAPRLRILENRSEKGCRD
jgi:hypothetical protein